MIEVRLSNQKFEHERSYYAFMTLISDVGGFNGAIVMLPAFIISFYAPRMFDASVLEDLPVKRRRKRQAKYEAGDALDERINRGDQIGNLTESDIKSIIDELSLTTKIKT